MGTKSETGSTGVQEHSSGLGCRLGGPIPTLSIAEKIAVKALLRGILTDTEPQQRERATDSLPICDYCGCFIEETDQQCAALHDGVCAP